MRIKETPDAKRIRLIGGAEVMEALQAKSADELRAYMGEVEAEVRDAEVALKENPKIKELAAALREARGPFRDAITQGRARQRYARELLDAKGAA